MLAEPLSRLCTGEMIARRRDASFPGEDELVLRHALVREAAYAMRPGNAFRRGPRGSRARPGSDFSGPSWTTRAVVRWREGGESPTPRWSENGLRGSVIGGDQSPPPSGDARSPPIKA
jgi:hypothetical protein